LWYPEEEDRGGTLRAEPARFSKNQDSADSCKNLQMGCATDSFATLGKLFLNLKDFHF